MKRPLLFSINLTQIRSLILGQGSSVEDEDPKVSTLNHEIDLVPWGAAFRDGLIEGTRVFAVEVLMKEDLEDAMRWGQEQAQLLGTGFYMEEDILLLYWRD